MTTDEFRRFGYQLIDKIADYREGLGERRVMATVKPGEVRARLPQSPPEEPESLELIMAELEPLFGDGLTHFQHPRFFGYFPANAHLASVLGDLLSSGWGQLGLTWQASPALTELEEVATDWLRQLIGLPESFAGVIQDTASTSTLVALISARERATGYSFSGEGFQNAGRPLTIYVSEQSHSSVEKAALLAGFGKNNLRLVAVDEAFALRPAALEQAIQADLAVGKKPCAVVATTGTTATTALDPVADIAQICARYGIWLHVDGAMAGSAMMLPECRWMWQGIEAADSVVLNPHKWLGAVFDCSVYYVKDSEHLIRVMSTSPSYLQTAQDSQVKNYRDWGIPLGRRFRALKLWFLLRAEGAQALRQRLKRDMDNAKWLEQQARATAHWRVVAPVALQTVCLRYEPVGLSPEATDEHLLNWVSRINVSGEAYLTPAKLADRWMVRVSIGSLLTERQDVAALWELMQQEVKRLG